MFISKSKLVRVLVVGSIVLLVNVTSLYATNASLSSGNIVEIEKGNDDLKYGQYVYVILKDGSKTVGKIVGKRNSKKYYVNQLDGNHHGMVHKKYIQKMTKDEVANYRASKEN